MSAIGLPLLTTNLLNIAAYGALATLALFVQQYSDFDRSRDFVSSAGGYNSESYFDFIIVGSGSSGSVLANRLSRRFKVLVLEAGGQPNPLTAVPLMAFPFQKDETIDWAYQTVPQRNACLGLVDRKSNWPRGKAEGGSSNLNAMIYLRGNPKDFDSMAARLQNPIWSYKSVENFYKGFEDFNDYNPNHGHGGEQFVENNFDDFELRNAFVEAGRELGYPEADLNSYHINGFMPLTFTTRRGVRYEDFAAFLKPAKNSPYHRLSVYKFSKVVRILIDKSRRAYGVEYIRHGALRRAYASKEVIVSAGAINSPQLLILSGIGPRQQLKNLGIPLVADLPVGQNLQDHVGTTVGMFSVDKPITTSFQSDFNINTLTQYLTQGTGSLTSSFVKSVGSVCSKFSKQEQWPDLQLTVVAISQPMAYESFLDTLNVHPATIQNLWKSTAGLNTFQIFMINARPRQRGEVTLISPDPEVKPRIDPKYLQNTEDVEASVEGIKFGVKLITSTKAFKKLGGKLHSVPLDPCASLKFNSDQYWECYLRHLTLTLYHPCCTCPMGNSSDPGRVTDSNFRVVGIQNLRVIDASSFPNIPSSNLNAPVNLVGEIGSHMICKQWIGKPCKY